MHVDKLKKRSLDLANNPICVPRPIKCAGHRVHQKGESGQSIESSPTDESNVFVDGTVYRCLSVFLSRRSRLAASTCFCFFNDDVCCRHRGSFWLLLTIVGVVGEPSKCQKRIHGVWNCRPRSVQHYHAYDLGFGSTHIGAKNAQCQHPCHIVMHDRCFWKTGHHKECHNVCCYVKRSSVFDSSQSAPTNGGPLIEHKESVQFRKPYMAEEEQSKTKRFAQVQQHVQLTIS